MKRRREHRISYNLAGRYIYCWSLRFCLRTYFTKRTRRVPGRKSFLRVFKINNAAWSWVSRERMETENYSAYYNREIFKIPRHPKNVFLFNLFYACRKEDADEEEKMNKIERPGDLQGERWGLFSFKVVESLCYKLPTISPKPVKSLPHPKSLSE